MVAINVMFTINHFLVSPFITRSVSNRSFTTRTSIARNLHESLALPAKYSSTLIILLICRYFHLKISTESLAKGTHDLISFGINRYSSGSVSLIVSSLLGNLPSLMDALHFDLKKIKFYAFALSVKNS